MPRLSRHLPRETSPTNTKGCVAILTALSIGLVTLLYHAPVAGTVVMCVLVWVFLQMPVDRNRLRRLAAIRTGEGICTFARSFERRRVDPWVIRAVHEELMPHYSSGDVTAPIRASDRIAEDVRIDPEDLDEMADVIARRAGYSLDGAERNPVYGRVETVGDLVQFFVYQPRLRVP